MNGYLGFKTGSMSHGQTEETEAMCHREPRKLPVTSWWCKKLNHAKGYSQRGKKTVLFDIRITYLYCNWYLIVLEASIYEAQRNWNASNFFLSYLMLSKSLELQIGQNKRVQFSGIELRNHSKAQIFIFCKLCICTRCSKDQVMHNLRHQGKTDVNKLMHC